jgi:hypothetical protein
MTESPQQTNADEFRLLTNITVGLSQTKYLKMLIYSYINFSWFACFKSFLVFIITVVQYITAVL